MNNELATNAMQNQMQLVMNRTKQQKLANLLLQGLNILWLRNWRLQPCFFCPGVCYEASEVMLLVSFLSSMLTRGLLEPKEPSSSFVASYQQPSAVPVEFHNYKDSAMRAAGILQVLLCAQDKFCSRPRGLPWSSQLRLYGSRDDQSGEVGLVES